MLANKVTESILPIGQTFLLFQACAAEAGTNSSTSATNSQGNTETPKVVVTVVGLAIIVISSIIIAKIVDRYIENRKINPDEFEGEDKADMLVRTRLAYVQYKRAKTIRDKRRELVRDIIRKWSKKKTLASTEDMDNISNGIEENTQKAYTIINVNSIETMNHVSSNVSLKKSCSETILVPTENMAVAFEKKISGEKILVTADIESGITVPSLKTTPLHIAPKQTSDKAHMQTFAIRKALTN